MNYRYLTLNKKMSHRFLKNKSVTHVKVKPKKHFCVGRVKVISQEENRKTNSCPIKEFFTILWRFFTFRKKDITFKNTFIKLVLFCNNFILTLYQILFFILSLFCLYVTLAPNNLIFTHSFVYRAIFLSCFFVLLIISRSIKIVKCESKIIKDEEKILKQFNTVIGFTSILIAIIFNFWCLI